MEKMDKNKSEVKENLSIKVTCEYIIKSNIKIHLKERRE